MWYNNLILVATSALLKFACLKKYFLLYSFFQMKKCQCCLEGGGGNHGCGNNNNKAAPICTRYNTTLSGKGTCYQKSGINNDSFVSFFFKNYYHT
jgi:hypothetical protein